MALLSGAVIVIVACVWGAAMVTKISDIPANVRPATPQEAPDGSVASRTVVGEPDSGPSALPGIKGVSVRLLLLALAAVVGAGMAACGASVALSRKPRAAPKQRNRDEGSHAARHG